MRGVVAGSRVRETAWRVSGLKRAGWVSWNVLTALSLLLCLAPLALWVRSYWVRDTIGFGWAGGNCHVAQSILGRLHVLTTLGGGCSGGASYGADRLSPQAIWSGGMSGYPTAVRWLCGFVCQMYDRTHMGMGQIYRMSYRLVVVPYWFPVGALALPPLAWAAGLRRRVGLLDLMIIVAAVAVVLALPAFFARAMNRSGATPG
jgi:hypothetical protein